MLPWEEEPVRWSNVDHLKKDSAGSYQQLPIGELQATIKDEMNLAYQERESLLEEGSVCGCAGGEVAGLEVGYHGG